MGFLAEIIVGFFIELCCGFIGHWFIRIITLGRVQLDFSNSEFTVATIVGVLVLLGACIGWWALR